MENKFYWDGDTINYYVELEEKKGWVATAFEIYKYVADECDWDGEADLRSLYLDLMNEVNTTIVLKEVHG